MTLHLKNWFRHEVDAGWAWVVVGASFFIQFIVFGIIQSFGIIFVALLEEFKAGEYETAWIGSLAYGLQFLIGPITTALCEHFGCRKMVFCGTAISMLALFASSFSPNLPTLYFTFGILWGIGASFAFFPCILVLRFYFSQRISLANGITMSGAGIGTIVINVTLNRVTQAYGWRVGIRILGGICAFMFACGSVYLPPPSDFYATREWSTYEKVKFTSKLSRIFDVRPWKQKPFVVYVLGISLVLFGYFVPYVHLVRFAETFGVPSSEGALLVGYMSISQIFAKLFCGRLADMKRVKRLFIIELSILGYIICNMAVTAAKGYHALLAYAVVFGFFDGLFVVVLPIVICDIVGKDLMATAIGGFYGFVATPMMLGPPLAGQLYDAFESYDAAFIGAALLMLIGGALMYIVYRLKPDLIKTELQIPEDFDAENIFNSDLFSRPSIHSHTVDALSGMFLSERISMLNLDRPSQIIFNPLHNLNYGTKSRAGSSVSQQTYFLSFAADDQSEGRSEIYLQRMRGASITTETGSRRLNVSTNISTPDQLSINSKDIITVSSAGDGLSTSTPKDLSIENIFGREAGEAVSIGSPSIPENIDSKNEIEVNGPCAVQSEQIYSINRTVLEDTSSTATLVNFDNQSDLQKGIEALAAFHDESVITKNEIPFVGQEDDVRPPATFSQPSDIQDEAACVETVDLHTNGVGEVVVGLTQGALKAEGLHCILPVIPEVIELVPDPGNLQNKQQIFSVAESLQIDPTGSAETSTAVLDNDSKVRTATLVTIDDTLQSDAQEDSDTLIPEDTEVSTDTINYEGSEPEFEQKDGDGAVLIKLAPPPNVVRNNCGIMPLVDLEEKNCTQDAIQPDNRNMIPNTLGVHDSFTVQADDVQTTLYTENEKGMISISPHSTTQDNLLSPVFAQINTEGNSANFSGTRDFHALEIVSSDKVKYKESSLPFEQREGIIITLPPQPNIIRSNCDSRLVDLKDKKYNQDAHQPDDQHISLDIVNGSNVVQETENAQAALSTKNDKGITSMSPCFQTNDDLTSPLFATINTEVINDNSSGTGDFPMSADIASTGTIKYEGTERAFKQRKNDDNGDDDDDDDDVDDDVDDVSLIKLSSPLNVIQNSCEILPFVDLEDKKYTQDARQLDDENVLGSILGVKDNNIQEDDQAAITDTIKYEREQVCKQRADDDADNVFTKRPTPPNVTQNNCETMSLMDLEDKKYTHNVHQLDDQNVLGNILGINGNVEQKDIPAALYTVNDRGPCLTTQKDFMSPTFVQIHYEGTNASFSGTQDFHTPVSTKMVDSTHLDLLSKKLEAVAAEQMKGELVTRFPIDEMALFAASRSIVPTPLEYQCTPGYQNVPYISPQSTNPSAQRTPGDIDSRIATSSLQELQSDGTSRILPMSQPIKALTEKRTSDSQSTWLQKPANSFSEGLCNSLVNKISTSQEVDSLQLRSHPYCEEKKELESSQEIGIIKIPPPPDFERRRPSVSETQDQIIETPLFLQHVYTQDHDQTSSEVNGPQEFHTAASSRGTDSTDLFLLSERLENVVSKQLQGEFTTRFPTEDEMTIFAASRSMIPTPLEYQGTPTTQSVDSPDVIKSPMEMVAKELDHFPENLSSHASSPEPFIEHYHLSSDIIVPEATFTRASYHSQDKQENSDFVLGINRRPSASGHASNHLLESYSQEASISLNESQANELSYILSQPSMQTNPFITSLQNSERNQIGNCNSQVCDEEFHPITVPLMPSRKSLTLDDNSECTLSDKSSSILNVFEREIDEYSKADRGYLAGNAVPTLTNENTPFDQHIVGSLTIPFAQEMQKGLSSGDNNQQNDFQKVSIPTVYTIPSVSNSDRSVYVQAHFKSSRNQEHYDQDEDHSHSTSQSIDPTFPVDKAVSSEVAGLISKVETQYTKQDNHGEQPTYMWSLSSADPQECITSMVTNKEENYCVSGSEFEALDKEISNQLALIKDNLDTYPEGCMTDINSDPLEEKRFQDGNTL